ncbi:Membrane metallo-endopeptidase-like 1 [Portunus trituberculatus]|uniref:Membrane metallo-endopeptidase-like 1 n=1 Tax=Portunus trituberculatus TaxID=210409 RepID=A0A5B7CQ67_PORTR|nr:Membrane metallo-endopeptidase-like 1 [Portunus trituberculatus]
MFIQQTSIKRSRRNARCGQPRVPFLILASYSSTTNYCSACDNLESKTAAAPHSYPGCFLRSVAFWLGPASRDARLVIFDSCSSTSTLQDVLTSFTEAREWWRELAWPDPETRGVVAVGLLENLCSLATRRCQGVISRCPRDSTPPVQPYFDIEFCSCLKSVSRVAEEVQQLSDDLGLEEVVEEMRKCGNRGAADQAKDTVSTLLSSVGQNLENLLDQYIDTAIDQAVPKLREEVVEVCERGNSSTPPSLPSTLSLLQEHLPHSLSPRSHYVPPSSSKASSTSSSPCLSVCSSPSLFQRLLVRLWDAVVLQFMVTVAEKTGKQTSEYFSRVHSILEASLALFTSTGRLHPRAAATPGYRSVAEQVKGQRMSSPALILQYYLSRYTQQTEPHLPTVAHVLVRAFFSQPGHLTVRVLEVRDVEAVTGKSLRYHVTVQVVPREVCCGGFLHRTTTVTHCPASFYETFEFPTGECRGEGSAGWLQFTLEAARGSSGSGLFLGEAFVPLASIPYVDSPELQNTTLRLTTPVFQPGVPHQQQVLMQDYPQPGIASPALVSTLQEVMAPVQSSALPSPLQASKHPKNVIEDKIRKMKEKHMQRNVPDPNYEEVAVQLKRESEHDTGVLLPSSKSERRSRPYPLPSPDPGYVEEEVTLQKYEEHDKHPRNVKVATRNTRPQIPVSDKETTEIKEAESNSSKSKKSPMENTKESDKLSSKSFKNGTQICETIACYEAATRISESMDLSVNPCEDFYQFACGGWIDKHPPPESGWEGTYIDAVKRTDKHLVQILETPAKPDAPAPLHEIRSLYNSCLDTDDFTSI